MTENICPECSRPLMKVPAGGRVYDQCDLCKGIWLEKEHFEILLNNQEYRRQVMDLLPDSGIKSTISLEAVHYRPCPICNKLMVRANYGRISGIIVDNCQAHGFWFDQDELRHILDFIEIGGLKRLHARQILDGQEQQCMNSANQALPTISADAVLNRCNWL